MRVRDEEKRVYQKERISGYLFVADGIVFFGTSISYAGNCGLLGFPGPVFSTKRVGIHQKQFKILKFRTMRTDTPKDMPTHLLQDPDQYINGARKICVKDVPDERYRQLINIVKEEMSIIGPRPALWNQYDLIEEREKYGANDILPGLTGWAQIHGRDELDIPEKAKLDGYYVDNLSFGLDVKCFFSENYPVSTGGQIWVVVEGGTGEMKRKGKR